MADEAKRLIDSALDAAKDLTPASELCPRDFSARNVVFGAPIGWDEERDGLCDGLPAVICQHDGIHVSSVWTLSDAQRQAVADGADIVLTVISGQPPVMLQIADDPAYEPRARPGQ